MFCLNDTMRYHLCPGRTDMRKGINSLIIIGCLWLDYVFCRAFGNFRVSFLHLDSMP